MYYIYNICICECCELCVLQCVYYNVCIYINTIYVYIKIIKNTYTYMGVCITNTGRTCHAIQCAKILHFRGFAASLHNEKGSGRLEELEGSSAVGAVGNML